MPDFVQYIAAAATVLSVIVMMRLPSFPLHNSIPQAFHVSAVKAPKTLRGRSTKPGGAGE
jgi:hypothetical protein